MHSFRTQAAIAGHANQPAIARALLLHEDPRVRATSLRALERLGVLAKDELLRALHDDSRHVRIAALTVAALHPEVNILHSLSDHEDLVVEQACWSLGERTYDDAAVDALCKISSDHHNALVREAAVAALGALGDSKSVHAILRCLEDKPTVRRRAVLALAPFCMRDDVISALQNALNDKDWQVRQAAEDLGAR